MGGDVVMVRCCRLSFVVCPHGGWAVEVVPVAGGGEKSG